MQKNIFSFILIFSTCFVFAQTNSDTSKHLVFKGVPLDGTLDQYVSKIKQNGFIHVSSNNGTAILQGDFAGYKDCYVGVSTLKQKDLVHKIVVNFSECETWSTLSGNYFNLKSMLTEKYGKPAEVIEKFEGNEPRDDLKMYSVRSDKCKYYSTWTTEKGDIQLSIDRNNLLKCFVKLIYFDKINSAEVKKQAIDDL